ncbi:MAG TPA: glycosyltransferase family 2 protein [Candidatus Saccharimonadales bacterium]|nr:glycosyltransferase family 2 protein [Candidatus Saccharimonadales bacterium]
MKLVVQIPCYNEEETLPLVLKDIPKKIPGIDTIEILVIDDGSTDRTVEVAKKHGVKHFVVRTHRGLARSFHDGVMKALELGADIIVNTDGDNQYPQQEIGALVKPILDGKADVVIADRQVQTIAHFSKGKKIMQALGTKILNAAAGTQVPDAPSGFRAYSRESILQLNIITRFSYTMETIIQAGNKGLIIASVPVITNPKTRESRLFKSSWEHIIKSGSAITRAFIMYRPYVLFNTLGVSLLVLGTIPFLRYLFFVLTDNNPGNHLQSLIAGAVLLVTAFISFTLGVIADLTRINRSLNEQTLEHIKRMRFQK